MLAAGCVGLITLARLNRDMRKQKKAGMVFTNLLLQPALHFYLLPPGPPARR